MNDFVSTTNSSTLLKNDYPASTALQEAIKRRKAKLVDQGSVSDQVNFSSKDKDKEGE